MTNKPMEFPLTSIPDGFIRDYLDWVDPLTEAPDEFHVVVALALLSTVTERKVYLSWGVSRTYPTIWGLLIGRSGISRKSSALSAGRELLRCVDKTLLMPSDFSPEAFMDALSNQPSRLLLEDEMGSFLAKLEKSYMSGMKELITDLFDAPPERERKLRSGDVIVKDPFFNFVAGSTPEWLSTKLKEEDLMSGFLNRWIAVTGRSTKTIPVPAKQQMEKFQALVEVLKGIRKVRGRVKLSKEANSMYDTWYRKTHAEIRTGVVRSSLGSFWVRLENYVVKIALLFELTKGSVDDIAISGESMESAIALVEYFKHTIRIFVEEELVFTNDMKNKRRVFNIIRERGEINKGELLNKSNLLKRAFDPVIETLIYEGLVEIIETKQEGRGRRGVTYRVKED